jgi:hypothetical protein
MVRLPPNPRLHTTATPLEIAQQLDSWGLQVLPAKPRDKAPVVDWKNHQITRTTKLLSTWFRGNRQLNFWVMCGQISKVVVVDADSATGDAWWREQLGDDIMTATAQVKTRKGKHYWFRIPDDWTAPVKSWSIHDDRMDFDVRGDRTGVIVPPSVHESGLIYAWDVPFTEALPAPAALLDGSLRAVAGDSPETRGDGPVLQAGGGTRSLLARLLANPPGEGGRNDWLTKVAGHHAKQYRDQRDAYDQMCGDANAKLTPPLGQDEVTKITDSIWNSEHENNRQRAIDADCGWLQGNGKTLFTQIQRSQGDERVYELGEWGNFDATAKGVTRDPDQSKVFWVGLHTRDGDLDVLLRATTLGDDRKLRAWLAGFGCTAWPPGNMFPKEGTPGVRLQRYLESQNPPTIEVTETLGWNQEVLEGQGAFVTHDGIVLASGPVSADQSGVRADPVLLSSGIAPHQYGFERDADEASRVLTEVLSFHDETVTAVFGAWWAACLLKPQLQSRSALFPFVGIQAPSESGKTNGFFDMMVQLNGSVRGEVVPTRAVLRNMIAAHNNGIVWVDDLDDPAYLMELLRAATSGGTIAKMGEDRTTASESTLVAPVVISGEQLGLGSQKALLDRAVMINVNSPVGRLSRHDPTRPQWDDILALREEYKSGLHVLSGWYVMKALSVEPKVAVALAEGRTGSGRAGDKVAILRAGARLLDFLCGHGEAWAGRGPTATRLEAWLESDTLETSVLDNSLTLELMPWALRMWNFPHRPELGENGKTSTPVWVEGWTSKDSLEGNLRVWVNTDLLARAWDQEKRGRVEARTQSAPALKDQLNAMGGSKLKQFRLQGSQGEHPRLYYRSIDGEMARSVIRRAQGIN